MEECPICYELQPNFTTPCNHRFHKSCLNLWLKDHYTCPICRNLLKNKYILWSNKLIRFKTAIIIYNHYFILKTVFSKKYITGNNLKSVQMHYNKNQIIIEARINNRLQTIKLYSKQDVINSCFESITNLINKFNKIYN